jgi:hypothetical protein
MPIHILNCVSMPPWWPRWHIGGVSLLVETDEGPVLVDTGLGLYDYAHPSWLVRFYMLDTGIHRDPEHAAVRLDFKPEMFPIPLPGHMELDWFEKGGAK